LIRTPPCKIRQMYTVRVHLTGRGVWAVMASEQDHDTALHHFATAYALPVTYLYDDDKQDSAVAVVGQNPACTHSSDGTG
jgi:hypothetical protein